MMIRIQRTSVWWSWSGRINPPDLDGAGRRSAFEERDFCCSSHQPEDENSLRLRLRPVPSCWTQTLSFLLSFGCGWGAGGVWVSAKEECLLWDGGDEELLLITDRKFNFNWWSGGEPIEGHHHHQHPQILLLHHLQPISNHPGVRSERCCGDGCYSPPPSRIKHQLFLQYSNWFTLKHFLFIFDKTTKL